MTYLNFDSLHALDPVPPESFVYLFNPSLDGPLILEYDTPALFLGYVCPEALLGMLALSVIVERVGVHLIKSVLAPGALCVAVQEQL